MTDATSGNFDRAICARAKSERAFLAGAALLFAATAAATIVWCNAYRRLLSHWHESVLAYEPTWSRSISLGSAAPSGRTL